ncbi:MAG: hypothetical protein ACYSUB_21840 [Planctomycetota bacterium]
MDNPEAVDLLIDKQKLIKNKVLKANGLYDSDAQSVNVRRQLIGKIFGLHKPRQWGIEGLAA